MRHEQRAQGLSLHQIVQAGGARAVHDDGGDAGGHGDFGGVQLGDHAAGAPVGTRAAGQLQQVLIDDAHLGNGVGVGVLMGIGVIKVLDVQKSEKLRQDSLLRDALESAKAASEAKSDFLSRVSHDIRTPLNAIIGMSLLGQMRIDDLAEVKNCFEKIDQSSKYLLSLINDILCMSKIESGKIRLDIESFKLEELFGGLWQIIETQVADKNITYRCTGLENVCDSYDGDVTKIHQILLNLLTNAVKFTPQGGDFSQREKKYFKSPVDNRENAVYLNSHICRMNIKIVFSIP